MVDERLEETSRRSVSDCIIQPARGATLGLKARGLSRSPSESRDLPEEEHCGRLDWMLGCDEPLSKVVMLLIECEEVWGLAYCVYIQCARLSRYGLHHEPHCDVA